MGDLFDLADRKVLVVVGEDDQGMDILRCPDCGFEEVLEHYDVIGSDDDSVFCNGCSIECFFP